MTDAVLLVEQQGHIATMTINRPEKRNALNPEIHAAWWRTSTACQRKVRCAVS